MFQVQLVPSPLPRGITCTPRPPCGVGFGICTSEIAAEAQKTREVGQEASLGDSDREIMTRTTMYGTHLALRKETSHSVRNSRAIAPSWEVIQRARGGFCRTSDLAHILC